MASPPGTPSRHSHHEPPLSHESFKNVFPFLSITCRSTRVKPLPPSCYPGIGGIRGAKSGSAECQIVQRDFVKTRVREGPQGPRVMRRRWRHSSGAMRTAVEPTTARCAEAFPSPCQGSRHKRFDTWGSACRRHPRLTSGRRFAARPGHRGCGGEFAGLTPRDRSSAGRLGRAALPAGG